MKILSKISSAALTFLCFSSLAIAELGITSGTPIRVQFIQDLSDRNIQVFSKPVTHSGWGFNSDFTMQYNSGSFHIRNEILDNPNFMVVADDIKSADGSTVLIRKGQLVDGKVEHQFPDAFGRGGYFLINNLTTKATDGSLVKILGNIRAEGQGRLNNFLPLYAFGSMLGFIASPLFFASRHSVMPSVLGINMFVSLFAGLLIRGDGAIVPAGTTQTFSIIGHY